jgi:thiol-disulfide isomerase/thioredoxin
MIVRNAEQVFGFRLWQTVALLVGICMLGSGCTIGKNQHRAAPLNEKNAGADRLSEVIVVNDVNGKERRLLAEGGQSGTLFFFVLHDCPAANAYAPEMNRIAEKYGAKGVRSYLVYAESDLGEAEAQKHAKQHAIKFPAVIDRHQELVKLTGATISPEAAVMSADKRVVYHGRIDDRIVAPGKRRVEPTTRDLREALDAMLEGKPVPIPVTQAVGCYLPGNESKLPVNESK